MPVTVPLAGQPGPEPVKFTATSKTLLVPACVNVPVTAQLERLVLLKLMLLPLPLWAKVTSRSTAAARSFETPVIAPVNAVAEPLKGENEVRENVPEGLGDWPVNVPLIAVEEFTLPCAGSVTTVVPPAGTLPGSAYAVMFPEKEQAPVMVGV